MKDGTLFDIGLAFAVIAAFPFVMGALELAATFAALCLACWAAEGVTRAWRAWRRR